MEKISLSTEARDVSVKTSAIRSAKKIPAVVYGHGFTSVPVSVEYSEFLKVHRKAGGSHLVDLTVDGKKVSVLIHEVQKHPATEAYLHIDFFAVSAKEKIHVQIPVHLTGKSQAQVEGAEIIQNLHAIDVKVLPADLIDAIEVDLARLEKIGDAVHVGDVASAYPKLEFITPNEESIASASAPKEYSDELETADVSEVATVQDEKAAEKAAEEGGTPAAAAAPEKAEK